jgi:hypothetical protein
MARALLKMATDDNVADAVKLTAIRDALDRGGVVAKTAVEVNGSTPPSWDGGFGSVMSDDCSGFGRG